MFTHFSAEKTDSGLDFDVEVEPGKRVYCFFGRNGVGKTSLLENLASLLLLGHSTFSREGASNGASAARRFGSLFWQDDVFPALRSVVFHVPVSAALDGEKAMVGDETATTTSLEHWAGRSHGNLVLDRPVVAIGAQNRGFSQNLSTDRVRLLGSRASRFLQAFFRSYNAATRQAVETESLAEWLAARLIVNPAFAGSDDRSFEVTTMLHLMEELEPSLFRGLSTRSADGSLPAIRFSNGQLTFSGTPLDKLPSGFIAIMKLFQEILGGLAGWTAFEDSKELESIDGIVLIDEIEAHLHPTWQAKIVPLLKRFFPRATFFLCTHSPLIVATTEEGEAYELVREDQRVTARKLGNPRAWYLADVYEQAFHVDLPGADEEASVPDLLLDFSIKVKDHLRTKDAAIGDEAKALYERLVPSIPSTDPRRASLEALRKMVA